MEILITNTTVLTANKSNQVLINCDVKISKNKIVALGQNLAEEGCEKIIDGKDHILMPGLVNAHTHVAMTLFRNYGDDLPFFDWLTKRIFPAEAKLSGEDVYWGTRLGLLEMLKGGTTCFADMYFFMEDIARAVDESGMRGVLARGVMDIQEPFSTKIAALTDFYNNWHKNGNDKITMMLAPHAPYTCSDELLKDVSKLAKEWDIPVHIHMQESEQEIKDSKRDFGLTPFARIEKLGIFENKILAAHCVYVDETDLEIMQKYDISVAHNPQSNLKLANGIAPVHKMLKKGINVALGTDGAASNNNLNMFEEINYAALLAKGNSKIPTEVPAVEAIRMATINGAKALGLDKEIGSIEVGKKADLILIDTNKPHFQPVNNPLASIVYTAQAADVSHSIVDGELLMEDYQVKNCNHSEIFEKVNESKIKLIG